MSEVLMPSYTQRVCIAGLLTPMRWAITRGIARTTGISALGECPRHWYQCQGQARPALTLLYKNDLQYYHLLSRSQHQNVAVILLNYLPKKILLLLYNYQFERPLLY